MGSHMTIGVPPPLCFETNGHALQILLGGRWGSTSTSYDHLTVIHLLVRRTLEKAVRRIRRKLASIQNG